MKLKAFLLPFLIFPFLFACNNDSLNLDVKLKVEKDGFVYSLIGDEIEIYDYTGNAKELIFPSQLDGYPVTSVELEHNLSDMFNSVVFSEGIKSIFGSVYGTNLNNVSLPNSLTNYNAYIAPSKYNEYENGLYLGNSENPYLVFCGLIDENVTSCSIKEGTKFLSDIQSESLVNLNIPNSIIQIDKSIFIPNVKLNEYENGLYLGNSENPYHVLMKAKNKKEITKLIVHKNAKHIFGRPDLDTDYLDLNSFGMDGCELLTEVVLPDGLKTIMEYAFLGCYSLKKIDFPNSLVSIGNYAFSECASLESAILPNDMTYIGNYAFSSCKNISIISLPKKIKKINIATFGMCEKLKSITIPNSVYYIDNGAFYGCKGLKEIKLGDKLIAMNSSFYELGVIEELIIPDNFKYFLGAFSAISVRHLKIGKSLTYYPYDEDYNLAETIGELNVNSVSVSKHNKTFVSRKNCNAIIDIKTNGLVLGTSSTKIPDNATSIAEYAFSGNHIFEDIDIPNSVTKIGNYAFKNCRKIESVFIPSSVIEVGREIFYNVGHDFDVGNWGFPFDIPLKVYCEATSKPDGWDDDWNVYYGNRRISNIVWGATLASIK